MLDEEPTLLLTRPEPQSREFLAYCEERAGRRFSAVVSPIIEIVPVAYTIEPADAQTLIFTSSHAVRQVASSLPGQRVVTVGEATAALARSFGADAKALGKNVEEFLASADEIEYPATYVRGVHVSHDLSALLSSEGLVMRELVVYDQVERPLSTAGRNLLSGVSKVLAPVFSARSAEILSKQQITAPTTILALSDAVKSAWKGEEATLIAHEPTRSGMFELINKHIRGAHIAARGS